VGLLDGAGKIKQVRVLKDQRRIDSGLVQPLFEMIDSGVDFAGWCGKVHNPPRV